MACVILNTPPSPAPPSPLFLLFSRASSSHSSSQTCLEQDGKITLTAPVPVISTTYPEAPSTTLEIFCNDTDMGGPVLWKLDWIHDATSVAWTAVPSTGLAYPGETMVVSAWSCCRALSYHSTAVHRYHTPSFVCVCVCFIRSGHSRQYLLKVILMFDFICLACFC